MNQRTDKNCDESKNNKNKNNIHKKCIIDINNNKITKNFNADNTNDRNNTTISI